MKKVTRVGVSSEGGKQDREQAHGAQQGAELSSRKRGHPGGPGSLHCIGGM